MARIRVLSPTQMEEWHNTKMLLRPINRGLVEQYAQQIKDGADFPVIILGTYPSDDGKGKLIIDGNHIYRGCQLANKPWKCEFVSYDSLPAALADQLKRNAHHGLRITAAQRDARIKELIEKHNWSVRQVAEAVSMSTASVSRINRDIQNKSKTGKRGVPAGATRGAVVPHALPPRQFIRAVENLQLTLEKPEARAQALAEIYSPERDPREIQRLVTTLRTVAEDLAALVRQPASRTTRQPVRRAQSQQMELPAA